MSSVPWPLVPALKPFAVVAKLSSEELRSMARNDHGAERAARPER